MTAHKPLGPSTPGVGNLVAHRGEPRCWPENSLVGFGAVLAAGARCIETDVQLTADGVPVLSHDDTLARACASETSILASDYATIARLPAGFPGQFGSRFADNRIAPLAALAELLGDWPGVTAFIELKRASIRMFGAGPTLDRVLRALEPALPQCVLISFDRGVLLNAKRLHAVPIGWVLPRWNAQQHAAAIDLGAEYLFVDLLQLPSGRVPLWPGPWRWAAYVCNEPDAVAPLLERGFALVETDDFRLLARRLPP